jgi:hypothetical protein
MDLLLEIMRPQYLWDKGKFRKKQSTQPNAVYALTTTSFVQ